MCLSVIPKTFRNLLPDEPKWTNPLSNIFQVNLACVFMSFATFTTFIPNLVPAEAQPIKGTALA